jgi:hypothetical protein
MFFISFDDVQMPFDLGCLENGRKWHLDIVERNKEHDILKLLVQFWFYS